MAKKRINGSKNKNTEAKKETIENTVPVPAKTYNEGMVQGMIYGVAVGAALMFIFLR